MPGLLDRFPDAPEETKETEVATGLLDRFPDEPEEPKADVSATGVQQFPNVTTFGRPDGTAAREAMLARFPDGPGAEPELPLMTKGLAGIAYGIQWPIMKALNLVGITGDEDEWSWGEFKGSAQHGLAKWSELHEDLSRKAARNVSKLLPEGKGRRSLYEAYYAAYRKLPEMIAARLGAPGALEIDQFGQGEELQTMAGTLASAGAGAVEFFGGMVGFSKGAGGPANSVLKRSLLSAIVLQAQKPHLEPKEFVKDAASYFAIMGVSGVVSNLLEKAIVKAPTGKFLAALSAKGRWGKAASWGLEKPGNLSRYLLVTRADDWIESVFNSAYYAWRARPEGVSFGAAFLGAFFGPATLMNYFEESIGGGVGQLGLKNNASYEDLRTKMKEKFEKAITEAPRAPTESEAKGLDRAREILGSAWKFKQTLGGEGFGKETTDAVEPFFAEAEAAQAMAERGDSPDDYEQPDRYEIVDPSDKESLIQAEKAGYSPQTGESRDSVEAALLAKETEPSVAPETAAVTPEVEGRVTDEQIGQAAEEAAAAVAGIEAQPEERATIPGVVPERAPGLVPPSQAKAQILRTVKPPTAQVHIGELAALRLRFQMQAKGARAGKKVTLQDVKKTQKELHDYIIEKIPKHEQGSLLTTLRAVTNEKSLAKARRHVEAVLKKIEANPRIVMAEKQALRQRFQQQAFGARKGAQAAKAEIGAAQKELTTFIRETLPPVIQGKLLATLRGVRDKKTLDKAIAKTETVLRDWEHRQARASLKGTVKGLNLRKMRPEYARQIGAIIEGYDFAKPTAKKLSALESLRRHIEAHEDHSVPAHVLAELSRLSQVQVNDLATEDLQTIEAALLHITHLNNLKNKLIWRQRDKKRSDVVKTVLGTMGIRGKEQKEKPLNKRFRSVPGDAAKKFWAWGDNLELMARIFDGQDDGTMASIFVDDMNAAEDERINTLRADRQWLQSELEAADLGVTDEFRSWSQYLPGKADIIKTPLANGKTIELSRSDRVSFFLASQDPHHRRSLLSKEGWFLERGFQSAKRAPLTEEDIQSVVESLTDEELAVAGVFSRYLNEYLPPRINEVSVDLVGFETATVQQYFPKKTHSDFIKRKHTDAVVPFAKAPQSVEDRGIFKARKSGARAPVVIRDAFQVIAEHRAETAAYRSYARQMRNMKGVLNDSAFRQGVRKWYGGETLVRLDKFVARIEGDSYRSDPLEGMLDKLRGKIARAILTMKPIIWMRQATSYPLAALELDVKHWAQWITPVLTNQDTMRADAFIDNFVPQLWQRLSEARIGRDIGDVMAKAAARELFTTGSALPDKMAVGLRAGDAWAIRRIALASMDQAQEETGMPLEDPQTVVRAKYLMEKAVRRTQPTWHAKDRAYLTGSTHPLVKILTPFRSFREKLVLESRHAYSDYAEKKNKTIADRGKLLSKWMWILLMSAEMYVATNWMRRKLLGKKTKDEGEDLRQGIQRHALDVAESMIGYLPAAGEVFSATRAAVEYGSWGRDVMGAPVIQTVNMTAEVGASFLKAGAELAKGSDWMDEEKFKKEATRFLREFSILSGRVTGYPIEGFIELGEMVKDLSDEEDY